MGGYRCVRSTSLHRPRRSSAAAGTASAFCSAGLDRCLYIHAAQKQKQPPDGGDKSRSGTGAAHRDDLNPALTCAPITLSTERYGK
jgi:hypothetical protein